MAKREPQHISGTGKDELTAAAQAVTQAAQVPPGLLHRLVQSLAPDRVLLFGSRARSRAHPGSDIDLLLVGAWSMERAPLLRHARHLVMHSFPRVDLVLCNLEEIAAAEAGHAPFLRSILESGVIIYQRLHPGDRDPRL